MKKLLPIIFLLLLITACAPNPVKEAQGYQIKEQADQDALNQSQQRQQDQQLHEIQIQQLQLEEQHREATAKEWRAGLNRMIHYGFIFGTIGVCVSLLALAFAFSYSSIGTAKAFARAAEVRANLIPLDRVTRQFPLVLQYIGRGKVSLTNINTGETLLLDTRNEPDRQLIATSGATQIAGVIASEARQSTDPAGVAIVQPPVIDVKDELLTVGKEFLRNE